MAEQYCSEMRRKVAWSIGAFECTRIYELFDLMNSYIRVPIRAAVLISSSYESYEHANAISESETRKYDHTRTHHKHPDTRALITS